MILWTKYERKFDLKIPSIEQFELWSNLPDDIKDIDIYLKDSWFPIGQQ
jgi:hypothetical protein